MINEETFYEDIDLSQEEFYEKLSSGANIGTSQPSPESVMKLWDGRMCGFRLLSRSRRQIRMHVVL